MSSNIKAFKAGAALEPFRFVKHNSADNEVIHAANAVDSIVGITTEVSSDLGEMADVNLDGWKRIELGGAVTRGDYLVATTDGKAIKLPDDVSGVLNARAKALESGVSGDIIQIEMIDNKVTNVGVHAFVADNAITAGCVVKIGDSDTDCAKATTSTDYLMGIALNSVATTETCYVKVCDIADAIAGASVTRGQLLTANAASKAIAAAPANDTNIRTVGMALKSGEADETITVLISPGSMQGIPA